MAREAINGEALVSGHVLFAPSGGLHLKLCGHRKVFCQLSDQPCGSLHTPSVDVLFNSASYIATKVIAVILTGMGTDGANGMKSLRENGAYTIAQDEASSVVYGMPRAAKANGAARIILPISSIGPEILRIATGSI